MLRYGIIERSSNRWNAYEVGSYALDSDAEWIPVGIRTRAARMLTDAVRVESPAWVAMVYGYFRNMYARDGLMWTLASDLVQGDYPDEWHAGYVWVRKYFPEHVLRADLIRDPGKGYGSWPCVKCDQRVQYEARYDAHVVYPNGATCTDGGRHEQEQSVTVH
jgi:hypothetical protein